MSDSRIAMELSNIPLFIGEDYRTVVKKLCTALRTKVFETYGYTSHRFREGVKILTIGKRTTAYFNHKNKLVYISTDNKEFTGYHVEHNGELLEFKNSSEYIEIIPKIFNRCSIDMEISYCEEANIWFKTYEKSAVFNKRKKNKSFCNKPDCICSNCFNCGNLEMHIIAGIDGRYDILSEQKKRGITLYSLSITGLIQENIEDR